MGKYINLFISNVRKEDKLRRLSFVMKQLRPYADKNGLRQTFCYYKQWGVGKKSGQGHRQVHPLRFSKSGMVEIEKAYATHYVESIRIVALKERQEQKQFGDFCQSIDTGPVRNI